MLRTISMDSAHTDYSIVVEDCFTQNYEALTGFKLYYKSCASSIKNLLLCGVIIGVNMHAEIKSVVFSIYSDWRDKLVTLYPPQAGLARQAAHPHKLLAHP